MRSERLPKPDARSVRWGRVALRTLVGAGRVSSERSSGSDAPGRSLWLDARLNARCGKRASEGSRGLDALSDRASSCVRALVGPVVRPGAQRRRRALPRSHVAACRFDRAEVRVSQRAPIARAVLFGDRARRRPSHRCSKLPRRLFGRSPSVQQALRGVGGARGPHRGRGEA